MREFTLEAENEVSKTFKSDDIFIYVGKAVDEDEDKHFLVFSIPKIPHLNVERIQYPFDFDTIGARDIAFNELGVLQVANFFINLENQIKFNIEKAKEDEAAKN